MSVPSRGLTPTTRRRITRRRKRTRSRWHGLQVIPERVKECLTNPLSLQGCVGFESTVYERKHDICQQDGMCTGMGKPLRDSRKTPISAHASAILVCAASNPCTRHGSLQHSNALSSGFICDFSLVLRALVFSPPPSRVKRSVYLGLPRYSTGTLQF